MIACWVQAKFDYQSGNIHEGREHLKARSGNHLPFGNHPDSTITSGFSPTVFEFATINPSACPCQQAILCHHWPIRTKKFSPDGIGADARASWANCGEIITAGRRNDQSFGPSSLNVICLILHSTDKRYWSMYLDLSRWLIGTSHNHSR
jgi:hypothetical protein